MTEYTNVTLIAVDQEEAAAWLSQHMPHVVYLSPTVDDITVLYDNILAENAHAEEPLETLLHFVAELSYSLDCAAWLCLVNADVFIYSLYLEGELVDTYGAPVGGSPEGGDAEVLAEAFGLEKRTIRALRQVLKHPDMAPLQRHAALSSALELSLMGVGIGYHALEQGTLPQGITDTSPLLKTTPRPVNPQDEVTP